MSKKLALICSFLKTWLKEKINDCHVTCIRTADLKHNNNNTQFLTDITKDSVLCIFTGANVSNRISERKGEVEL